MNFKVPFPVKVAHVKRMRLVEQQKISSKLFCRRKVVDVNEGVRWGEYRVVDPAHNNLIVNHLIQDLNIDFYFSCIKLTGTVS